MSWLSDIMGWGGGGDVSRIRQLARSERIQLYGRYLRAYQGYSVRGVLNTSTVTEWRRCKFNLVQPVVSLSSGWFASKPVDWDVDGDRDATALCYEIWDRSGSDAALLENATACSIYGDLAAVATQDGQGRPLIEFLDPCICDPRFDGSDYSRLCGLEVAYEEVDADGKRVLCREIWEAGGVSRYRDDALISSAVYDVLPAVWIRNTGIKGLPFGISDVEPILELVEEYDHVASKQTRVIDYYSSPNIVFQGLQKGSASAEKGVGTVFYLPTDGKAYFLEWSGSGPATEDHLTRIRNAIAEVSQVPAVAFGQMEGGLHTLSGVALQVLYGPLLNKTARKHASWRPALEYVMWRCLVAAGRAVELGQVNCRFSVGTPVDGQSVTAVATARVASRIASRRTVMNDSGIEDADAELKRILVEERVLSLGRPGAAVDQDANTAARAGARGMFAQEVVDGTGLAKQDPAAFVWDGDVGTLLEQADAIFQLERKHFEGAAG